MGGRNQTKEFIPPPSIYEAIKFCDKKLRATLWQIRPKKDGSGALVKFPGAARGNKIDAHRKQQRIDSAMEVLGELAEESDGQIFFITLTSPYDPEDETSRQQSWKNVLHRMKRWEANIHDIGLSEYFTPIEAHAYGGCHAHCAAVFYRKVETYTQHTEEREINRLCDNLLREKIKGAWGIGFVDIEITTVEEAKKYLSKEVGKQGHVEDALLRAKNNWEGEYFDKFKGRMRRNIEHMKNDCKKLFRQYYGARRKLFRVSKGIRAAIKEADRVHKENDQLTEAEKELNDQITVQIPWDVVRKVWFTPKTGEIDQLTEEGRFLRELYEHEIKKKKTKPKESAQPEALLVRPGGF